MATVRQHKRRHPSVQAGTCSGASAAHCPCTHSRHCVAAVLSEVGPAKRAWLFLRAEPLTRTDSWVTALAKSQHISGVRYEPVKRAD